ncbi:FGGY carbohydrate kinase domain-containing protein [Elysia marginata]|uniref:FGGY carbohydrate kinase domain-containing protein n=1 Tax=Elysia marginata TaxID=1093978 RepID=A0AAV4H9M9_9GAST|nr:FGGY carbohydrate kinase domain-containing protein [Elysia marginata]
MNQTYFVGVDVGTSSVRASVVSDTGKRCSSFTQEIRIWNPCTDFYQQSSENIWEMVSYAVQKSISDAQVLPENIKGIGFDATCSMVVLDEDFQPLTVSPHGDHSQNVILWMDHRAKNEVEVINATGHSVLNAVGGIMSLEMQPPKLMWLKKNLPETWKKANHFFDLPDFLSWRATSSLTRGMCSVVCKWSYSAVTQSAMGWDESFFKQIGLEELAHDDFSKIGKDIQTPGSAVGSGLSPQAAQELGLLPGTPVGTSLIDAHAGALGCLGCCPANLKDLPNLENRLVLIAGTSTCHIICSNQSVFVPGVWGPFLSAVLPDMWVNEGGQSSSGSLLDFVTSNHPAFVDAQKKAIERGLHIFDYLNEHIQKMAEKQNNHATYITQDFHVWPDFHGNRAPVADPNLRGMVLGLSLSATVDDLPILYLATIQALAYGTRHIISEMEKHGLKISLVYLCGGLRKNALYVQTHADVLGQPVVLPDADDPVLLGAAMLGAQAYKTKGNLRDVMTAMGGGGICLHPDNSVARFHKKKYTVFLEMLKDQMKYRDLMSS